VLRGGRWQDVLVGGAGRDRLSGGGDADIFKFKPRSGVDEIVDFQPGKDRIDLTALDLRGFGAIQRDTTEQGWAVARIPDAGVAIVFHEVKWSDLGADSFLI
jgi:serralysin